MTGFAAADPGFPGDGELVAAVLAGEREAYTGLVRRHQAALYRHALGMVRDGDAAADLVQDAFVKAYTSLAQCQDPERFRHWAFRILRNRCLDYLKNRRRTDLSLEDGAAHVAAPGDPDAELERGDIRRSLEAALESLPEAQREAFLLKHVQELSYEEISDLLGASESALKMRVKRAREALQALLGRSRPGVDVTQTTDRPSYQEDGAIRTLVEPGAE